jgi:predicted AlkP superfamily pyrophosphatase or phosphodiesterase
VKHLNVSKRVATDEVAVNKALHYLTTRDPFFTFLYFDHVDETGHKYGFGEHYEDAIVWVDLQIGRILDGRLKYSFIALCLHF